ncbi:MAG: 6-phosphofructokinase [Oscillospiraceae bacterium]|nr:6-phosphofructokinase [Oscillospiraceae bacterium]
MNIAVAQSGGPTCAINASLVGVFKQGLLTGEIDAIFGSINGIEGMIQDKLLNLKSVIRTNEDMELLRQTPSTILGSCRYKLPDYEENPDIYEKILHTFELHRISVFIYIGGNDSMDTVVKLSGYLNAVGSNIKVIGVPKTIDNDLPVTDHTPGFGSASKYVATTVQEIIRDSSVYSLPSVTIIEIMGRHSGWLTASTCMLRANGEEAPHLIYLPETDFSAERFMEDVRKEMAKHKAVVVAVSEGISLNTEDSGIAEFQSGAVDNFGHKYLSGVGKFLERLVADKIGCKVRSVELNVMQRCSSHICSKTDIDEAERIGRHALRTALDGETGKMMYFRRVSNMPYAVTIEMTDASNVANLEKKFPKEWISPEKNQVTDAAIGYFLPLIQGEVDIYMKNGMPVHFHRPLQVR